MNPPDPHDHIVRVLEIIHRGEPVEIRAIFPRGTRGEIWSGYFDDYNLAADAAIECEKHKAEGVYMILNQLKEGLIARSPNILSKSPRHTTSDHDVAAVQWVLIDVDPIRPSGISATDAEIRAAKKLRDAISEFFDSIYVFPEQHKGFSGNGYHLIVNCEHLGSWDPVTDLRCLSDTFTTETTKVDCSVGKKAQLTKLYGTMSRKGYSIAGRPHRRSFLEY